MVLTPEMKGTLSDLRLILIDKFIPEWEKIKDSLVLFQIEAFSDELKQLAAANSFQYLVDYANRIKEDVEMIDLESLKETLYECPVIIEQLTQFLKS